MRQVRVTTRSDRRDGRGASVALGGAPFEHVPRPRELHVASIVQGAVRGNHLHAERDEVLVIHACGPWSLHWDASPEGPVHDVAFPGGHVVVVEVDAGCSHAVVNHAEDELWLSSFSSGEWDPDGDETRTREVWPARDRVHRAVEPPPSS